MAAQSDDAFLFSSEEPVPDEPALTPWNILIVDDEEGVHSVTELALSNVKFANRPLNYLHAFSGREARAIMEQNNDIAVVLLDVVMESEDEGLKVANYIRNDLGNHYSRIILRTGQPGQAPEERVVTEYDINDYKEKTELTYRKLYSAVYTALRSYRDIVALNRNRKGLEKVVSATSTILERSSLESFAEGVLEQLAAILYMDEDIVLAECNAALAEANHQELHVLATTGKFDRDEAEHMSELLQHIRDRSNIIDQQRCIRHLANGEGHEILMYLAGQQPIADVDRHILDLFCRNVGVAFDNIRLNDNLRRTQKEIVYNLCELAETRSKETGNHVRRVAHYSQLLAEELGLSQQQRDEVFLASPLHDVGKIGIPDAILNKPGKLLPEEWEIMKTHATIGAQIMERSEQAVMQAGAIIAGQHHENWDGSGYPHGFAGNDIHIYGRIVALADVFDALAHKRCYKEAWARDEIVSFITEQSGIKFDPGLIEIFDKRMEGFFDILDQFSDGDPSPIH